MPAQPREVPRVMAEVMWHGCLPHPRDDEALREEEQQGSSEMEGKRG